MTAGYSGTPLPRKLGIKEGSTVVVLDAPDGFEALLDPMPAGVTVRASTGGTADVLVLFATSRAELEAGLPAARAALEPNGGLWVAWPKRASGVPTDLTENVVREVGLAAALVDNKVCAIDDTWSGLRLVIRLADRPAAR